MLRRAMPLQKRLVEPTAVCRGTLPADTTLPGELEAVTNGTLSNVVRQLSSLSRHAEDMFGELFREAERLAHRSNGLQQRIDSLADRVTRLDSTVEEGTWRIIGTGQVMEPVGGAGCALQLPCAAICR